MNRPLVTSITVATLLLLTAAPRAKASVANFSMYELAGGSDVVLVGKVRQVGDDSATVLVDTILKGEVTEKVVTVSPITIQHCMGASINIAQGEDVLLLLKRDDEGDLTVVTGGQGKIGLKPETRADTLAAAERLIAIMAIGDGHPRNKAMIAEAVSPNPKLRAEALRYVTSVISHSKPYDRYKDELVALLRHDDDDVRAAALAGLQFAAAEEALPLIIEATRSANVRVVNNASQALAPYDTADSVAAIIALIAHPKLSVRRRAAVDLTNSRRPEAKAALMALLDDDNIEMRAFGARRLVLWQRRGEAEDIIPKLIAMLDDPEQNVRVAAARALSESRSPAAVKSLLGVLRPEEIDSTMEAAAVGSLDALYRRAGAEAKGDIDNNLGLIIRSLERGDPSASRSAVGILDAAGTPEALAALRRAAQDHPREQVRAYAQRCLDRRR